MSGSSGAKDEKSNGNAIKENDGGENWGNTPLAENEEEYGTEKLNADQLYHSRRFYSPKRSGPPVLRPINSGTGNTVPSPYRVVHPPRDDTTVSGNDVKPV